MGFWKCDCLLVCSNEYGRELEPILYPKLDSALFKIVDCLKIALIGDGIGDVTLAENTNNILQSYGQFASRRAILIRYHYEFHVLLMRAMVRGRVMTGG